MLVQWEPIYLNPLGDGFVHNCGFSGSSSPYTCICAISIMKYKLIFYHLHNNQTKQAMHTMLYYILEVFSS